MGIISLYLLILVFTFFGALGGYFFKRASRDGLSLSRYFIVNMVVGCSLYGVGAILNIFTLRYLPYTIVFPLTSVTYIWTLLLSYFFLKEVMTPKKIIGVLLIITGSFFLIL